MTKFLLQAFTAIALIASSAVTFAKDLQRKDIRVLKLSDLSMATIAVDPGGCVLSFPVKPSKVIIGRERQFDAQYIANDVALVALAPNAEANMFVYVLGRRYSFIIKASQYAGDKIVVVKDFRDVITPIEVKDP